MLLPDLLLVADAFETVDVAGSGVDNTAAGTTVVEDVALDITLRQAWKMIAS